MTVVRSDVAVLDNVVWHAVSGPQRDLADRLGRAGRFQRDVAPFSGMDDPTSAQAWDDLARLVGPGKPAILFLPGVTAPDGWEKQVGIPCFQMVATDVSGEPTSDEIRELGPQDVPDMLALVAATQPGPFSDRTIALGRYAGIRRDGRLVAMTGERVKVPGFTEVSAVCTSEDVRGQGLARQLVLDVVAAIRARGDEAFLHVETRNTPAIALYESMGFTTRIGAEASIIRNTAPEDD
jgi:ribosomal protein S18 acetylase RimI-like enzyme